MAIKAVCCGTCIHNVQYTYLTHPIHPSIQPSTNLPAKTSKIKSTFQPPHSFYTDTHLNVHLYHHTKFIAPKTTQPQIFEYIFFCALQIHSHLKIFLRRQNIVVSRKNEFHLVAKSLYNFFAFTQCQYYQCCCIG